MSILSPVRAPVSGALLMENILDMPCVRTPLPTAKADSGLLVAQHVLAQGELARFALNLNVRVNPQWVGHPDGLVATDRPQISIGVRAPHSPAALNQAAQLYIDPKFAGYPAVNLTWLHGAFLVNQLNTMQDKFTFRLPTAEEARAIAFCGGAMSRQAVRNISHVYRTRPGRYPVDGVGAHILPSTLGIKAGTVPVDDDRAAARANHWGIIDGWGNVQILTSSPRNPQDVENGLPLGEIDRLRFGGAFISSANDIFVDGGYTTGGKPTFSAPFLGLRLVAEPR